MRTVTGPFVNIMPVSGISSIRRIRLRNGLQEALTFVIFLNDLLFQHKFCLSFYQYWQAFKFRGHYWGQFCPFKNRPLKNLWNFNKLVCSSDPWRLSKPYLKLLLALILYKCYTNIFLGTYDKLEADYPKLLFKADKLARTSLNSTGVNL